jgi:tRNA G18 (ribose-2'-O)-methylase SpoU
LIRKLVFEEIHSKRPTAAQIAEQKRHPFSALVDNVRSLHNVGSIFRSADAALVEHLYLCGITAKPPRDEIRKTSLGAEETVPWSFSASAAEVLSQLKRTGVQIVALEHTDVSVDFRRASYQFPLCVVLGNEYSGIQEPLIDFCDIAVEIPMYGIKQSLNVSVAFGVMMYELVRQWEDQKGRK